MVRIFRDVHIRSIYISIDVAVHAGGLKSNFDVHGLATFHSGKTDHLAAPDATAMKLHISGNCYRDDPVYFNLISWSKFFALVVAHA